jgi:hypothetical protein
MAMARKIIGTLGLTAVAFSLASCSNTAGAADSEIATPVVIDDESYRHPGLADTPLVPYFAMLWGTEGVGSEALIRRDQAREARTQELIAQCMLDAGFEFIIHLASEHPNAFRQSAWRETDRAWIDQFGFGQIVAPTERTPSSGGLLSAEDDPNLLMLQGLSQAEYSAWRFALFGDAFSGDGGCFSWATELVLDDIPAFDNEFAPLLEAMTELDLRIWEARSEIDQDWSNCMADAGHPGLDVPSDFAWRFRQRVSAELQRPWDTQIYSPQLVLEPDMARMQALEIEWAHLSLDCIEAVDYWGRTMEQRRIAEAQFLDDHRIALAALRDSVEQRSPDGS